MAIDNIRYGYPTYVDDASVGGYNRKELRGLSKQAKRGTLTQRERARLKYLTDERKGRRRRGLLSGLGGAAATLGGLALAGKLGKGEGKGGGGAALMDAIKSRLAAGKDKIELAKDKRLAKKLGVDPREYVDDSPISAVTEDVSSNMQLPPEPRETRGADVIREDMKASPEQVDDAQEVLRLLRQSTASDSITSEGPVRGGVAVPGPEASNIQDLVREISAENQAPISSDINIDPEGLTAGEKVEGGAEAVLESLNRTRQELGLEPVNQLSEKAMQQTEAVRNQMERKKQGSGVSMPQGPVRQRQLQGPRALVDQIFNRYN